MLRKRISKSGLYNLWRVLQLAAQADQKVLINRNFTQNTINQLADFIYVAYKYYWVSRIFAENQKESDVRTLSVTDSAKSNIGVSCAQQEKD